MQLSHFVAKIEIPEILQVFRRDKGNVAKGGIGDLEEADGRGNAEVVVARGGTVVLDAAGRDSEETRRGVDIALLGSSTQHAKTDMASVSVAKPVSPRGPSTAAGIL